MMKAAVFVAVLLALPTTVRADGEGCIQGSPADTKLLQAFRNGKDDLIKVFRANRAKSGNGANASLSLTPVVNKRIRMECIRASLRRTSGTNSWFCENENQQYAIRIGSPGPMGPCISEDLAEYLQFAVTQAIECLSTPSDPIDPRVILKKINNESAFHFYQAYNGGVGMGQLTSIAVKQLAVQDSGFMQERVLNNPNPACDPFKSIVQGDVGNGPRRYPDGYCYWTSPDGGLARNLIFSTALYAYNRDLMRKANPRLDQTSLDLIALEAFGPQGLGGGYRLASMGSANASVMMQRSSYLIATQNTWRQVAGLVQDGSAAANDSLAETCVEPLPLPKPVTPMGSSRTNFGPAGARPANKAQPNGPVGNAIKTNSGRPHCSQMNRQLYDLRVHQLKIDPGCDGSPDATTGK